MPVEDHPVHASTRIGSDYRAGCHSRNGLRRKSAGYWVTVKEVDIHGYTGKWVPQFVPHAMSQHCRQILPLPECEGCEQQKDHEYINKMRGML